MECVHVGVLAGAWVTRLPLGLGDEVHCPAVQRERRFAHLLGLEDVVWVVPEREVGAVFP